MPADGWSASRSFAKLLLDAFRRHDLECRGHPLCSGSRVGVELEPELRAKPRATHHAQRVVAKRDLGRSRRAQPPRHQVVEPTGRVDEHELGNPQGHRVDREVSPSEVGFETRAELHLRFAGGTVVRVAAEGGDLADVPAAAQADRAEPATGVPERLAERRQHRLSLLRRRVGREVEVDVVSAERSTEEGIPYGSADERQLVARGREESAEFGDSGPGRELAQPAHRIRDALHAPILAAVLLARRRPCGAPAPRDVHAAALRWSSCWSSRAE